MIRLLAGGAALALPFAAMAQDINDGKAIEPVVEARKPANWDELIVVTAGGLLRPASGDEVQTTAILTELEPGLGVRIENRLRDEAGIVQFRS